MNIKDRVVALCKEKGTTMSQLAKDINISQGSFSSMIQKSVTTDVVERIAAALGVEPFELFVTREEIEEERKRRMARLAVPSATVVCPCCGGAVHIGLKM